MPISSASTNAKTKCWYLLKLAIFFTIQVLIHRFWYIEENRIIISLFLLEKSFRGRIKITKFLPRFRLYYYGSKKRSTSRLAAKNSLKYDLQITLLYPLVLGFEHSSVSRELTYIMNAINIY